MGNWFWFGATTSHWNVASPALFRSEVLNEERWDWKNQWMRPLTTMVLAVLLLLLVVNGVGRAIDCTYTQCPHYFWTWPTFTTLVQVTTKYSSGAKEWRNRSRRMGYWSQSALKVFTQPWIKEVKHANELFVLHLKVKWLHFEEFEAANSSSNTHMMIIIFRLHLNLWTSFKDSVKWGTTFIEYQLPQLFVSVSKIMRNFSTTTLPDPQFVTCHTFSTFFEPSEQWLFSQG